MTGVDKGVPDLASARVRILLVKIDAEVGDPDPPIPSSRQSFCHQLTCNRRIKGDLALARVWKAMREGAAGEWRLMS